MRINSMYMLLFLLIFSVSMTNVAKGQMIFGSNTATDSLVGINPDNGQGSTIASLGSATIQGLACDNDTGTLYGIDVLTNELVIIDPNNGTSSPVGVIGFDQASSLAFDPNSNTLYAVDIGLDELITINTDTGQGSSIGFTEFRNILGLAFDSDTNILYGVNPDLEQNYLVTIDTNSGVASMVGDIAGFGIIISLTYDPTTNNLYAADAQTREFINVNPVTAVGTVVGDIGIGNISALGACISLEKQVPTLSEWGFIALAVLIGAVGVVMARRNKVIA